MTPVLYFSPNNLTAYMACQRRFQLRYVNKLPWPGAPLEERADHSRLLGQRLHQLMHRHFLGLPVMDESQMEPIVQTWWRLFSTSGPKMPPGRRYPELTMTVPIAGHFLTGRFDLLIVADDVIQIFDWKTESQPRSGAEIEQDLQTRIYLALAAQGAASLGSSLPPDKVQLTYWYMSDPASPVTIAYDADKHVRSWAFLQRMVIGIDRQLQEGVSFPLTDDLAECGRCAYQNFCDRRVGAFDLAEWDEDNVLRDLEPNLP